MTGSKNSLGPVSLPAGSYDGEKLAKGLDAAADRQPGNQQAEIDKAIEGARSEDTNRADPALLPDHVFVDLNNQHGGTERRQVYSPKLADQHRPGEQPIQATRRDEGEDADKAEADNAKAIKAAVAASAPAKAEDRPEESRSGAADPDLAEEALSRAGTGTREAEETAPAGRRK